MHASERPWIGFNWRYDSGLVAGATPCYNVTGANTRCGGTSTTLNGQPAIDLSGLTADQEFEAGFVCDGVSEIRTASGISRRALLEAATSAERSSEHPLERAIVRFGEQQNIAATHAESFEYRIGQGVIASVQGEPIM